jgi:hypothetical protein
MTWTVVTDAQLAVNKPARSADIKAIRDNITALANGDSGAPQIQAVALADGAVTLEKLTAPVAGTSYVLRCLPVYDALVSSVQSATALNFNWVSSPATYPADIVTGGIAVIPGVKEFKAVADGSVTLYGEIRSSNTYAARLAYLKNGVYGGQVIRDSTSFGYVSLNISFVAGDKIAIYFEEEDNNAYVGYTQNLSLMVSNDTQFFYEKTL